MDKKKVHVPSLVLMIIGAVFCLLIPLVTYATSIPSLIMSITKRKEFKTTYAIVINSIALVVAIANHILAIVLLMAVM